MRAQPRYNHPKRTTTKTTKGKGTTLNPKCLMTSNQVRTNNADKIIDRSVRSLLNDPDALDWKIK